MRFEVELIIQAQILPAKRE
uniref:Uncharacterized protein n=1 Tax=Anguilla anguilla TaxID=7936 RepID=A0A0E9VHI2_ANGAN